MLVCLCSTCVFVASLSLLNKTKKLIKVCQEVWKKKIHLLETLWDIMRHFETLWDTLRHFDTWDVIRCSETKWHSMRHNETPRDIIRQYDTLWNPLRCNETWDRMEHQGTINVIMIGSSPFTAFDCCLKHSGQKYTESMNDLTSLLLFPD